MEFEDLLKQHMGVLERFVKYKIGNPADGEDVLQEVCLSAYRHFPDLKDPAAFKSWLLAIVRNKCNDHYRKKGEPGKVSLDEVGEGVLAAGARGLTHGNPVRDTLERLPERDRQILYLAYFGELSQKEIAARLHIPVGTVKSRLHHAKEAFKERFTEKGTNCMKEFPKPMPAYTIEKGEGAPFPLRHEELPGMFIIPCMGEKLSFAMYDFPERVQNGKYAMEAVGKVSIHGVEGVAIKKRYENGKEYACETVYAALSDTHCKYLGGMYTDSQGVTKLTTFLDGGFEESYGIGENNCGFPVERIPRGLITESSAGEIAMGTGDLSDVVGRYTVALDGKRYDTVKLVDFQVGSGGGMLCEYYLDVHGRTVLWRRFNKDDWQFDRYGKLWTEILPDNQRLTVNGETYVHWYDCITDYVL